MPINLLTLETPNMAESGCDFAFLPQSGKYLRVLTFRTTFDSAIAASLVSGSPLTPNPMRVCFWLTYGSAHAAYTGSHTPLPTDGVDGWTLDSNNPIEAVQEYKRWWHAATGRTVIEFCFTSALEPAVKGRPNSFRLGETDFTQIEVPYADIGVDLRFRSSLNERIEVWQERQEPYKQPNGSDIAMAKVAVAFDWQTE